MKKILLVVLMAAILLPIGCGKERVPVTARERTPGLAYDDSINLDSVRLSESLSIWEGTGYEPYGIDGTDGQLPPAFRDTGSLYGRMDSSPSTPATPAAPLASDLNIPENYERKLVKSASMKIEAEDLEATDQEIARLLKEHNAYSALTRADENSRFHSLRVPANSYENFLADMKGMGRIFDRWEKTEDVTLRYYDLEGRLATKKTLLRTYQSYLARARTIDEILRVEAKVSEVQYDIDRTGTQLRNLANMADYATIDLYIYNPVSLETQSQGDSFSEKVSQLLKGFGGFLTSVVLGFLGFVIYGIPVILIIILLFWLLFGKVGIARRLWGLVRK